MRHRSLALFISPLVILALCDLGGALASAQQSEQESEGYQGVTIEGDNAPPRADSAALIQPPANVVTWPGFDPNHAGGRFFLQTSRPVVISSSSSPGRYEVLLRDCRTHLRNTTRPLDTRYFNTPVNRAYIERRGRDLAFVFELRRDVLPHTEMRPGASGYNFVIIEFPEGNYRAQ